MYVKLSDVVNIEHSEIQEGTRMDDRYKEKRDSLYYVSNGELDGVREQQQLLIL